VAIGKREDGSGSIAAALSQVKAATNSLKNSVSGNMAASRGMAAKQNGISGVAQTSPGMAAKTWRREKSNAVRRHVASPAYA